MPEITKDDIDKLLNARRLSLLKKHAKGGRLTPDELSEISNVLHPEGKTSAAVSRLSVNQLSILTGKDRRTITGKVKSLDWMPGPHNGRLYDSAAALEAIYGAQSNTKEGFVSLEEARRLQVLADTRLTEIEIEIKQRQRPPLELVNDILEQLCQGIAATVKASGLPEIKANEIFTQLREVPGKLKW